MSTRSRRRSGAPSVRVPAAIALVVLPTLAASAGGAGEVAAVIVVGASAATLCTMAVGHLLSTRRVAWGLIAVWAIGRPANTAVLASFLGGPFPRWWPWTSIVCSLSGAAGASLLCLQERGSLRVRTVVSDASVVACCGILALWIVVAPTFDSSPMPRPEVVATLAIFTVQLLALGTVLMVAVHRPERRTLRWLAIALGVGVVGSAVGASRAALSDPLGLPALVCICLTMSVPIFGFLTVRDDPAPAQRTRRLVGRRPVHLAVGVAVIAVLAELALGHHVISGPTGWLVVAAGAAVVLNQALAYRDSREVFHELEASEERFHAAFRSAPMGIAIAEANGMVVHANPALSTMLGWPRELIEGLPAAGFLSDRELAEHERLQRDLARGSIDEFSQELTVPHFDGGTRRVHITVSRLDSMSGGIYTIAVLADVTEHHAAQQRLEHLATHDALTGLGNRSLLLDHLDRVLRDDRLDAPVAVLFVDLDQFKVVNDSLGHAAGDRLLLQSASRLEATVGTAGLVTRFGGDEFCVVLDPASRTSHLDVANRVAAALRTAVDLGAPELTYPSASIGLAISRLGVGAEALLSEADAAMYRAKERGRDRVESFTPEDRRAALDVHRVVGEMHRGLADGEFVVHHQPVFDVATGRILGTEALVRWNHPQRGLQLPGTFLPVAEATGLIVDLGEHVLRRACRDLVEWRRAGLADATSGVPMTVAVNVDVQQLSRPGFPGRVQAVLDETGLDAGSLWLELTETTLMADVRSVERSLVQLREMGVHLSVDDFGTGYSSLTYLKRFPVEALKIDRSFIAGLGEHNDDTEIVSALVSLGQRLDLRVVAEGVESQHQLDTLRVLGCPMVQGFLLGRPVPAEEIARVLGRTQSPDAATIRPSVTLADVSGAIDRVG